ncbi:MAG: hypothetical protein ACOX68_03550 [Candidatus Limivicinus sp.]
MVKYEEKYLVVLPENSESLTIAYPSSSACCDCAYCWNGICKHPDGSGSFECHVCEPAHCGSYIGKTDDFSRYYWVRACLERLDLTENLYSFEQQLEETEEAVLRAQSVLENITDRDPEYEAAVRGLEDEKRQLFIIEKELELIESRLSIRGGELTSWFVPEDRYA